MKPARIASVGERELDRPAAWEARGCGFDALANEGIGELGPGDADLELLERLELDGLEAGHERGQHPLAALDVERERPAGVEARREWPAPVERDETVRRLVPDDAAARGGDPDRAGGVRAERRVGEPCRQRRRGASARAAGDAAREARVRDVSEVRVLGGRPVRELVQVRLADVHVARILEPQHGGGCPLGHVAGEDPRAVGRLQPAGVEEVLDRQPDARSGDSGWARKIVKVITVAAKRPFRGLSAIGIRFADPDLAQETQSNAR